MKAVEERAVTAENKIMTAKEKTRQAEKDLEHAKAEHNEIMVAANRNGC